MFGERTRVSVAVPRLGVFTAHNQTKQLVASGKLMDSKKTEQKSRTVYLLGGDGSSSVEKARIIATFKRHTDSEITYVAAASNKVFYAPDIIQALSERLDFSSGTLECHYEKSCGAVVFRRKSGNVEFLLVKNKKGKNWGFPKGHIEKGETEKDTAVREVFEETGLSIKLIDGFRVESEYHPRSKVIKKVVFFLAEMPDEEIMLQQSEIDRFMWADYGLAQQTFRFNNDRSILTHAKNWLGGRR